MKAAALYAGIAVLATLAGAQTQTGVQKMGGWSSSSSYNQLYNPKQETTFSGKIVGISDVTPSKTMSAAATILVKSKNGGTSAVDLGPAWFIDNQRTKLHVNDEVKVTGVKTSLNNRSFYIARKVIRGNHALYVREVSGFPIWVALRDHPDEVGPGAVAFNLGIGANEAVSTAGPVALAVPPPPPTVETTPKPTDTADVKTPINGTVSQVFTAQNPQTGQMEQYVMVSTPNGPVNVDLGPQWYMQQQPISFSAGNNISVQGVPYNSTYVLPNNGHPIYLANGLNYGNQFMIFRNGQITAFNAWY
ncbi:MAG TPA: hypothetical protein VGL56_21260 [Fimbriimonadaceae bacterium]|jgi:hypothetical protein